MMEKFKLSWNHLLETITYLFTVPMSLYGMVAANSLLTIFVVVELVRIQNGIQSKPYFPYDALFKYKHKFIVFRSRKYNWLTNVFYFIFIGIIVATAMAILGFGWRYGKGFTKGDPWIFAFTWWFLSFLVTQLVLYSLLLIYYLQQYWFRPFRNKFIGILYALVLCCFLAVTYYYSYFQ